MAGTNKQREEINRTLVSMQMEKIGLTYEDAVNTPEFWRVYTLTTEQSEEWRKDALKLIQKTFKCNKKAAERTRAWFEVSLGLRIYDGPEPVVEKIIEEPKPIVEQMIEEQYKIESLWVKIKRFIHL